MPSYLRHATSCDTHSCPTDEAPLSACPPLLRRGASTPAFVGGSRGGEGEVGEDFQEISLLSYCNAFWSTSRPAYVSFASARRGVLREWEVDWGANGYKVVMDKVAAGGEMLGELAGLFRRRAIIAEQSATELEVLSRSKLASSEVGTTAEATRILLSEFKQSAESQIVLCKRMRGLEDQVEQFVRRRDGGKKKLQGIVEALWKLLGETRLEVKNANFKYKAAWREVESVSRDVAHGKKSTAKLGKAKASLARYEGDYRSAVLALHTATSDWKMQWRRFLDLVEDQEEERLEFVKAIMSEYSDALASQTEDEAESVQRSRIAFEGCDPAQDVGLFSQRFGTGNEIPDSLAFCDLSDPSASGPPGHQAAEYPRTSTRSDRESCPTRLAPPPKKQRRTVSLDTGARAPRSSTARLFQQQQQPKQSLKASSGNLTSSHSFGARRPEPTSLSDSHTFPLPADATTTFFASSAAPLPPSSSATAPAPSFSVIPSVAPGFPETGPTVPLSRPKEFGVATTAVLPVHAAGVAAAAAEAASTATSSCTQHLFSAPSAPRPRVDFTSSSSATRESLQFQLPTIPPHPRPRRPNALAPRITPSRHSAAAGAAKRSGAVLGGAEWEEAEERAAEEDENNPNLAALRMFEADQRRSLLPLAGRTAIEGRYPYAALYGCEGATRVGRAW
ncbi:hypothetical protein JCM8097_000522 [Rhodosporidiobolus ruineniae]